MVAARINVWDFLSPLPPPPPPPPFPSPPTCIQGSSCYSSSTSSSPSNFRLYYRTTRTYAYATCCVCVCGGKLLRPRAEKWPQVKDVSVTLKRSNNIQLVWPGGHDFFFMENSPVAPSFCLPRRIGWQVWASPSRRRRYVCQCSFSPSLFACCQILIGHGERERERERERNKSGIKYEGSGKRQRDAARSTYIC